MLDLTFGEQVKIVLKRKGMTIKRLAELMEERTGKKMSRQNLTQRLGRDNFQEQDMREIAAILECPFRLSILDDSEPTGGTVGHTRPTMPIMVEDVKEPEALEENERDITVGELLDIHEDLDVMQSQMEEQASTVEETEPIVEEDTYTGAEYTDAEYAEDEYMEEEGFEEADLDEEYTDEQYLDEEYMDEELDEVSLEDVLREVEALEKESQEAQKKRETPQQQEERQQREAKVSGWRAYLQRKRQKEEASNEDTAVEDVATETELMSEAELFDEVEEQPEEMYEEQMQETEQEVVLESADEEEDLVNGDVNPYTGREYESNCVRMHPSRIGYVQVYDRSQHKWTDMTEWAFLGYQERKKALLGKDYVPPIYLD